MRKNVLSAVYLARMLKGAPRCPLDPRTISGKQLCKLANDCEVFELLLQRAENDLELTPEMIDFMANHEEVCDQHETDEPEGIILVDSN
jgi:hypothetical protein